MKKLLSMSIFLAFAIAVPMPTVAGAAIISGISRPPSIVFAAHPEVEVIPASDVYIVADADADRPQANSTDEVEKRQNESLEKETPTESKGESNWKINVLPRPDSMKSPIEKKEDQFHLPPDRF